MTLLDRSLLTRIPRFPPFLRSLSVLYESRSLLLLLLRVPDPSKTTPKDPMTHSNSLLPRTLPFGLPDLPRLSLTQVTPTTGSLVGSLPEPIPHPCPFIDPVGQHVYPFESTISTQDGDPGEVRLFLPDRPP